MLERAGKVSAEFLLVTTVVIWAANNTLVKWALGGVDPLVFNSIRFGVASGVIALVFLVRSRWVVVQRGDWVRLVGLGILASVAYQMAFIMALRMTTVANCSVLIATSPLWTMVFYAWIHKERILPEALAGMIISLVGVVMIIIGSGHRLHLGGEELIGDLISLIAAVIWALNSNFQKSLLTRYSSVQLNLVSVLVGAIGLTLFALPSGLSMDWSSVQAGYIVAAVLSGGISIGLASIFWSVGVKRLGPAHAANFSNLVPVIAFAVAFLVIHEQVAALQLAGSGVTIFGVWLARR